MPAVKHLDPLRPAITVPRQAIHFAVSQHLDEFSEFARFTSLSVNRLHI
jgi:hypothetical protein